MDVDGGSGCMDGCDGARHMVMDNGQCTNNGDGRGGEMSERVGQGKVERRRKVRDHSLTGRLAWPRRHRHSALAS